MKSKLRNILSLCGIAIFHLKFPSLLRYDTQRHFPRIRHNLISLYGVANPPGDTYLRERLGVHSEAGRYQKE